MPLLRITQLAFPRFPEATSTDWSGIVASLAGSAIIGFVFAYYQSDVLGDRVRSIGRRTVLWLRLAKPLLLGILVIVTGTLALGVLGAAPASGALLGVAACGVILAWRTTTRTATVAAIGFAHGLDSDGIERVEADDSGDCVRADRTELPAGHDYRNFAYYKFTRARQRSFRAADHVYFFVRTVSDHSNGSFELQYDSRRRRFHTAGRVATPTRLSEDEVRMFVAHSGRYRTGQQSVADFRIATAPDIRVEIRAIVAVAIPF